eukprot:6407838-Amphidinium_carterae.1
MEVGATPVHRFTLAAIVQTRTILTIVAVIIQAEGGSIALGGWPLCTDGRGRADFYQNLVHPASLTEVGGE